MTPSDLHAGDTVWLRFRRGSLRSAVLRAVVQEVSFDGQVVLSSDAWRADHTVTLDELAACAVVPEAAVRLIEATRRARQAATTMRWARNAHPPRRTA